MHGEGTLTFNNGQQKKGLFNKGKRIKWLDDEVQNFMLGNRLRYLP